MPDKRFLDEDANAYRVFAMLLEPIVSESFAKMKEERVVDESGKGSENAFLLNGIRSWPNLRQLRFRTKPERWETHATKI